MSLIPKFVSLSPHGFSFEEKLKIYLTLLTECTSQKSLFFAELLTKVPICLPLLRSPVKLPDI